jgi:predicted nuclease of restriction endonuclease-like (RecB) superfamily
MPCLERPISEVEGAGVIESLRTHSFPRKRRTRSAQIKAALSVNRELVVLYSSIGKDILARQKEHGWGAKVIERLATDLRREFPEMAGFSPSNLKYMRAFAETGPDFQIVQQAARRTQVVADA